VKNIAMAIQIYLTDYDRLLPGEHNAEAMAYFNEKAHAKCTRDCCPERLAQANPYLKAPVILDEYIKSREVWKCPSARTSHTFYIMDTYMNSKGTDDWLQTYKDNVDSCPAPKPCHEPFPSGWGGSVKASIGGHVWCTPEASQGAFDMTVGVASFLDVSTSSINDATKFVVCGDGGANYVLAMEDTSALAYPDSCRINHVSCSDGCGSCINLADSGCCTSITSFCAPARGDYKAATDPTYRKKQFGARHLGGSNVGFADGHAKWMDSESILFDGTNESGYGSGPRAIENLQCCMVTEILL